MTDENGNMKCDFCSQENGYFNADTGNHVRCEKLESILKEMEEAYSTDFFSEVTKEELDNFPGLITRNSAAMGRHLAQVIREKMKEEEDA